MRNYIILNNQNSNTISGLIIQELAPISKPAQRTQIETIDGRDGDIVTPLGYAAYDKTFTIGLYGTFDINEIIAYFSTQGQVIFSNEPNKYYNYQIVDQIDYERLVRYRVATVTMHVQPFKYSATEGTITVDASDTVSGEGSDIALDGTAEAPFNILRHKGNATQQTYSGKNLAKVDDYVYTSHGITYTSSSDGTITINGTSDAVSSGNATADYPIHLKAGQVYTLSANNAIANGNVTIRFGIQGGGVLAGTTLGDVNRTYTFTAGEDNDVAIQVRLPSGVTISNFMLKPQLELGSQATEWEKFVGGTASPNPDYPQDIQVVTGEQTIQIRGKNLCHVINTEQTINGVKFTPRSDGSIVLSGTATAQCAYPLTNIGTGVTRTMALKQGTYRVSSNGKSSAGIYCQVVYQNTDSPVSYTSGTFTLNSDISVGVFIRVNNGINCDGWTIYPQLELGSEATEWEQYKGARYNFALCGANKLKPQMTDGYVNNNGTMASSHANGEQYSEFISVKPNTEYTFEIFATTGTASNWIGIGEYYDNAISSFIQRDTKSGQSYYTFTTSPTTNYVIVSARNLATATQVEFNIGGRTTYEPYTPLELVKIGDYVDEPVKVDGTWYIRRAIGKVVLDGTESWHIFSNGNAFWLDIADAYVPTSSSLARNTARSDYYTEATWSDMSSGSVDYGIGLYISSNPAQHRLVIRNKDLADITALTTWLSTHNTTVYYALATPTDEAITDQDLIDALDDYFGQAHAYKGQTNITVTPASGNAPAILSVNVNEDNESTVTNAGNTTSRPILTIYGQGDIGVYINDVEVLDVALGDEGYITLDSVEMEAYKDTTANLKNRLVTGDYSKLALNAGANKIRFTGKVTKYEISKYSRWL